MTSKPTKEINGRKCVIEYENDFGKKRKEQCPTNKDKMKIGLCMIVKNEQDNIERTMNSVLSMCNVFIMLDTGSEDETIQTIINFCEKHKIPLYLISHPFENFSITRNIVLEYADDKADYLLLMDSNDELKNYTNEFKTFLWEHYKIPQLNGFYIKQEWNTNGKVDRYFNIRLIKTGKKWEYRTPVHEYIACPDVEKNGIASHVFKIGDGPYIYQDRSKDAHKSTKRFQRDKQLLFEEYQKNPHDGRTLFYLAQTCSCLAQFEEAYKYYLLRTKEQEFLEEVFHAYLRAGDIAYNGLKHSDEECIYVFLKALEFSCTIFNCPRAEPSLRLAEIYNKKKNPQMAYYFIRQACASVQPTDCSLFVDGAVYDHTRWSMLAQNAKQSNDADLGFIGACFAYNHSKSKEDQELLLSYVDKTLYNCDKLLEFVKSQPVANFVSLFIVKKKENNLLNIFLTQNVKPFLAKFESK